MSLACVQPVSMAASRQRPQHRRQRFCVASADDAGAQPATSDVTSPSSTAGFIIRRATWTDVKPVSKICAAAFADVPGKIPKGPNVEGLADYMVQQYCDITAREIVKAMSLSLQKKEEGALQMRAARASRRAEGAHVLRTELTLLRMKPDGVALTETEINERVAIAIASDPRPLFPPSELERLRRQRQWVCFVAETPDSGLVGCAFISWMVPDAGLPPPFPTSRPYTMYVSNMGVAREQRRRGIARELLAACERTVRRWGHGEVWLHVDIGNETAAKMYSALGYAKAAEDPWWWSERRILLRRDVSQGSGGGAGGRGAGGAGASEGKSR